MKFHDIIKEAITGHRRIEITYQGRNDSEPTVRQVDPWLLADTRAEDGTDETALVGHQVSGGSGSHVGRFNFSGLRDVRLTDQQAETPPKGPADPANWGNIHAQW